jgi:acetyltransferase-like isoleucine patch superfamily enzyme
MPKRLMRRIYRKLFPVNHTEEIQLNIIKGNNVSVDPSSIISPTGKVTLSNNSYIGRQVEIGAITHIEIGFNSSIQDRCIILGDVEIGNYCTFAPNVYISSGRHYYNLKPNYYIKDQDELVSSDSTLSKQHSKKVTIGDDCWLGINSVIMSGLSIGRGCVIGANSVVTKNLEPFSVVAGAPAKLIKKRLDFIPKTIIKFDEENDLPNFYKGFFIDVKSLKEFKTQGGIASSFAFTCYLQNNTKKIVITIKKLVSNTITISYNNQNQQLDTNDFVTLTFDAIQTNYHKFSIHQITDKYQQCALIKSVEVLN